MQVRSSQKLSETLNTDYELALLFKLIATIDYEAPTFEKSVNSNGMGQKTIMKIFSRALTAIVFYNV